MKEEWHNVMPVQTYTYAHTSTHIRMYHYSETKVARKSVFSPSPCLGQSGKGNEFAVPYGTQTVLIHSTAVQSPLSVKEGKDRVW